MKLKNHSRNFFDEIGHFKQSSHKQQVCFNKHRVRSQSYSHRDAFSKSTVQARLLWQSRSGLSLWKSNKQIWCLVWCFRAGVCSATGKSMMFHVHITNIIKQHHTNKDVKKVYLQFDWYNNNKLFLTFVVNFLPLRSFILIVLYVMYGGMANENKNVLTHPQYSPFSLCVLGFCSHTALAHFPPR